MKIIFILYYLLWFCKFFSWNSNRLWMYWNFFVKLIKIDLIYGIHIHKMPCNALFFISKWPKINEVCSWIFILRCGPLNWFSGFKVMRWQVVSLVYFMEHIKTNFNTKKLMFIHKTEWRVRIVGMNSRCDQKEILQ